ncbi:hypothetical protein [Fischerella thermalis]|jgi:phosphatidylglycerophosphate synthase|uniref:Uncharacterized protein n=1 Tax=Fischerella thermalis JSC-11 TaxID=741277 RepID=G6FYK1_9CYAN|nr:hypothetical protein [Fischerella thermalis]EHC09778.1 hypothetical protein FJSC11DRAFT_3950 [Fischerella thermalis JSC-11]
MHRTLITTLIFIFLILFIISPFAALANLMLVLLVAAFFFLLWSVLQAIVGKKTDSHS